MRRGHLEILGLSLLALVGVMAVSASAAQAKWLLLKDGVSVLSQSFNFTLGTVELLVPNVGIEILCKGGTGTTNFSLDATHTKLSGSASWQFSGCEDVNYGEVCTVEGVGDSAGKISVALTGTGIMEGEKVLIDAASSEFLNFQYLGEECPFTELDGRVSGEMTLEVLEPLKEAALHQVHLVKQNLFYGGESAEWHAGPPSAGTVLGSISTLNGEKSAIHLVGL